MTIPYALRLICVCGASFAILFAAAGFVTALIVPAALRAAEGMRADLAARLVLGLRLLPSAFAVFAVAAICVPSFLFYEQRGEAEEVGLLCVSLFLLTGTIFTHSIFRTAAAWLRSRKTSSELALVGILRPRIVMSDSARSILSSGQLAAAISHEQAHAESRDNFKRFLIFLAPGMFPGSAELEQTWKRFAEWAADDRATAGDVERSVSLAGALVQIAKLGTIGAPAPLATPFLGASNDLEARVDRLLNPMPTAQRNGYHAVRATGAFAVALIAGATLYPAQIHELLERLVH